MDISLARQLTQTPDLSRRLRRLSFFDDQFRRQVTALADQGGLVATIDPVRLTRAFLAWGGDFTHQRSAAAIDRRDYIVFTAGMLLVRLLEMEPVAVARRPAGRARPAATATTSGTMGGTMSDTVSGAAGGIIDFWPEGFLCTHYCITVLRAVLRQEFDETLVVAGPADDIRIWWSFRENVREDRTSAIGFLDLFVGGEPNWAFPAVAAQRPAMRLAGNRPAALRQD